MRISDWSSDVCSSDLPPSQREPFQLRPAGLSGQGNGLEIVAIIVIATKIFPGEAGGGQMLGVPVSRRSTPVDAKHGVTSEYRAAQDRPGSEACEISGTGCSCLNDISCASKSIDGLVIFVLKVLIWIREPGTARRADRKST